MNLTRFDRPLDGLLDSLASSTLRLSDEDRDNLCAAAAVIRAQFGTGGGPGSRRPMVLITMGWEADPVVIEVEQLRDDVRAIGAGLDVVRDRIDEVLGTLRRRIAEPEPGTAPS